MLALEGGKNVLCEKALTVTEAQARKLVEKAREKDLFFMEAVWTRYFPWSIRIRELVKEGAIGKVHRVIGEFTFFFSSFFPLVLWRPSSSSPTTFRGILLSVSVKRTD